MSATLATRVDAGVDAWLRWLPAWSPGTHRGRSRMCGRCIGSPILDAAGIGGLVPHQVAHALTSRMQRIIDHLVDEYVEAQLPVMHAELAGEAIWSAGGYRPEAGLEPEYEGLDLDPEVEGEQPTLFTFAGLAEQTRPEPPLPMPPLSAEEKQQLRREMELADQYTNDIGAQLCLALSEHRVRITAAVARFVEPQIQSLLDELAQHLEPPLA